MGSDAPANPELTRRRRIAGAAGGALALAGAEAIADGAAGRPRPIAAGSFDSGVAAGSPGPRGVTLWTRVHHAHAHTGSLGLEVARDSEFRHVVARRRVLAHASADHTVNERISGLEPGEQYFYRFHTHAADSASRDELRVDFRAVTDVLDPQSDCFTVKSFRVPAGELSIEDA